MKKMNQWEMAKRLAECNHCDDFSCRGLVAGMLNSGGMSCPLLQATEPDSWDTCCVTSEHGIRECAQKWMSNHPELNPELDRLNQDCGVKRIWPDTPVSKERVAEWLSDSNLMLALADELDRAEKLHPDWPKDIVYQACILMEEAGEFMQAVMNYKFHGGSLECVVQEVQQTGAMVLRFMKNLPECENILASIKVQREEGHE